MTVVYSTILCTVKQICTADTATKPAITEFVMSNIWQLANASILLFAALICAGTKLW